MYGGGELISDFNFSNEQFANFISGITGAGVMVGGSFMDGGSIIGGGSFNDISTMNINFASNESENIIVIGDNNPEVVGDDVVGGDEGENYTVGSNDTYGEVPIGGYNGGDELILNEVIEGAEEAEKEGGEIIIGGGSDDESNKEGDDVIIGVEDKEGDDEKEGGEIIIGGEEELADNLQINLEY